MGGNIDRLKRKALRNIDTAQHVEHLPGQSLAQAPQVRTPVYLKVVQEDPDGVVW